jgi:hypothetical protein
VSFNKLCPLSLFLMLSIAWTSQVQATCDRTGADGLNDNGVIANGSGQFSYIVTNNGQTNQVSCEEDPDEYGLTFFKLAICKSNPISGDYSTCADLGDADLSAGLDHTIAPPAKTVLNTGSIDVPAGDYNYMVAIVSNKISITHTQQFANDLRGRTGQGKTCWTVSKIIANTGTLGSAGYVHDLYGSLSNTNTRLGMSWECGDAGNEDPVPSNTIIASFDGCDASFSATSEGTTSNGTVGGRLLKADNTDATDCENASRIRWVINYSSPLIVKSTSTFDLSFKTTNAFEISLGDNSGAIAFAVAPAINPPEAILVTKH